MRTCRNHFFEIFQMFQTTGGIPARQGLNYVGFELDKQCWNVKNTTSEGNQRVLVSRRAQPYKNKQGPHIQQNFTATSIKLNGSDFFLIIVLVFHSWNVHKRVQKTKEGLKLSPVGLRCLGLRGWKAPQRLNLVSKPILRCSWANKIRDKLNAIRKIYNDLRVGSILSGCLLGRRKIPGGGTAFILVYMQTF